VLTNLATDSLDRAWDVAIQPDGKIVAAGASEARGFAVVRYTAAGVPDASFGSGGTVLTDLSRGGEGQAGAFAVAVQSDGKIVAAGFNETSLINYFALIRYSKAGRLDPSFGLGGKVLTSVGGKAGGEAYAVAVQKDGKIVATGSGPGDFTLVRYTAGGKLDVSFGRGGKVQTSFGVKSFGWAFALAIQPDGRLVAAGFSDARGSDDFALARYMK
jgi:uncharacterized delta-60 repeat protein